MYKLPLTLPEDIANFGTLAKEFEDGKIEPVKFKITRVPMGIYEQRQDGVYMVRVRTTGGVIFPEQFIKLIETAQKHHSNLLHITTRQEIQIQNLELKEIEEILEELKEAGLSSKGGGGNTVRNILVSINSGISGKDIFDVTPHAMAITTKLIAEADSFTLPRKLKLAFATNEEETDYTAVNDLGFIATIKDNKKGFKVYLGGSVASKPTVGWVLSEFIPEEDLFAVAEATKQLFSNHGNRKNKHKARLRFIFYRLGKEEVFRLFNEYYEKARQTTPKYTPEAIEKESLTAYIPEFLPESEDFYIWKKRYTGEQVQNGYYSVIIPFIHGNIRLDEPETVKALKNLLQFVSRFGKDTIRFSTLQNIHLRNIPEKALPGLFRILKQLPADTAKPLVVNNIVSCTGADTCRLGIGLSKGLANAIRKRLEKTSLDLDKVAGLRIQISGCPNSCGQQVWADLGFSGKVLRNDRIYPGYQVHIGAQRGKNPHLGKSAGNISARDIPAFVEKLFTHYIERIDKHSSFNDYLETVGNDYIQQLINEYKEIPTFEDDKNYYFDWGASTLFSVAERGVGECSAGLFDMIDLDLKYIKESRKNLEQETDKNRINNLLYDIVFSSSRMLLITRGAEPKTIGETFDLFITHFIDTKLINDKIKGIIEIARDNKTFDFIPKKDEIYELADTVIDLYQNMDDSLQFKNVEQQDTTTENKNKQAENKIKEIKQNKFKDLRGVTCPMNFVQTKIQLSGMNSGEILEIWLDDGQPVNNVPGSVRNEGHEVIEQTPVKDYWKVVIRKK